MSHIHGNRPLIFISAAEPSADAHGAALIRATLARRPGVRFVGVAGPRMVAAGCFPVYDMTRHAAMLLGVFRVARRAVSMLSTSDAHLRRYPFDAAVVIDSPTLHLPLAGKAHAAGIPVLYYIAPQMWAWGGWRIHKLRTRVDRVAAILPFEEAYFRDRGIDARYVGHPLGDTFAETTIDGEMVRVIRGAGAPVVALLPGSRKHVVAEVVEGQLDVAGKIAAAIPGAVFHISVANAQVRPIIEAAARQASVSVTPHTRSQAELIEAADLVLVASGTATLQVAFHETPMVVMYRASRVFYHLLGRWMIRTEHLSLPNILAGREVVPEFMPYYTSTAPIAERAIALLRSPEERQAMSRELAEVVRPLRARGASDRTAEMLLDLIGSSDG